LPGDAPVTTIRVMTTTSLADVKAHLSSYIDSVHQTHERITITRNGQPAAILMSPDDLASLEETLDILSNAAVMADLREADQAIAAGDLTPLSQVRTQLPPR
jgi:antitoxin YefM